MASVYLKDGVVLAPGNKVALSDVCCNCSQGITVQCQYVANTKSKLYWAPFCYDDADCGDCTNINNRYLSFSSGEGSFCGGCDSSSPEPCLSDPTYCDDPERNCTCTCDPSPCGACSGGVGGSPARRYRTMTGTYGHCHLFNDCSGAVTVSRTYDLDGNIESETCSGGMSCPPPHDETYFAGCTCSPCSGDVTSTVGNLLTCHIGEGCGGGGGLPSACGDSFTLSDEYTTSDLLSHTENTMPDYPGWPDEDCDEGQGTQSNGSGGTFGCCSYPNNFGSTGICFAYRNLSDDELSYTIRSFKWRIKFYDPGEDKVFTWKERFTPEGGSPTLTDHEWDFTSSSPGALVYSPEFEISFPGTDGSIGIESFVVT